MRRVGSKSFTKTFARMTEARAWARAQEVNIDRDEAGFHKPLTIQLGDLLSRYLHEITPQKNREIVRRAEFLGCSVTPYPRQNYAIYRLRNSPHSEMLA